MLNICKFQHCCLLRCNTMSIWANISDKLGDFIHMISGSGLLWNVRASLPNYMFMRTPVNFTDPFSSLRLNHPDLRVRYKYFSFLSYDLFCKYMLKNSLTSESLFYLTTYISPSPGPFCMLVGTATLFTVPNCHKLWSTSSTSVHYS